jgi:hypothetical protein
MRDYNLIFLSPVRHEMRLLAFKQLRKKTYIIFQNYKTPDQGWSPPACREINSNKILLTSNRQNSAKSFLGNT